MPVTFLTEKVRDVLGEIKPLLEKHWDEIALNKDFIALDPDYAVYERMCDAGSMIVFTVREDGNLKGYAVYVISKHPHYKTKVFAKCDLLWISPECRRAGVGVRFLDYIEQYLKSCKVDVMHTYTKLAHPALAKLLEFRGHDAIEMNFSKVLKR